MSESDTSSGFCHATLLSLAGLQTVVPGSPGTACWMMGKRERQQPVLISHFSFPPGLLEGQSVTVFFEVSRGEGFVSAKPSNLTHRTVGLTKVMTPKDVFSEASAADSPMSPAE